MSKGNSRSLKTGWGVYLVIVFWIVAIGILLSGCGLNDVIDRIECGRHMQHCQGEGVGK